MVEMKEEGDMTLVFVPGRDARYSGTVKESLRRHIQLKDDLKCREAEQLSGVSLLVLDLFS